MGAPMNKSDLIKMRESITHGEWDVCRTTQGGAVTHWHITGELHGSVYPICRHVIEVEPDASEQLENAKAIAALPAILDHAIKLEEEVSEAATLLKSILDETDNGYVDYLEIHNYLERLGRE